MTSTPEVVPGVLVPVADPLFSGRGSAVQR
jgi:hypothetical protein